MPASRDVPTGVITLLTEPPTGQPLQLVAVAEDPMPIEVISPKEPENEIDVENPTDFEALNWHFLFHCSLNDQKGKQGRP